MTKTYVFCIIVLAIAWGGTVFYSFLSGVKKTRIPTFQMPESHSDAVKEQRRLMEESKRMREQMMRDTKRQIETFKNSRP